MIDAEFTNMDTFTRAFYREFGPSPSDYKKHPVPIPFFVPYGAKFRKLRKESIDVSMIQPIFIQTIRKPKRLCVIDDINGSKPSAVKRKKSNRIIPLPEALSDVLGPLRGLPNLLSSAVKKAACCQKQALSGVGRN